MNASLKELIIENETLKLLPQSLQSSQVDQIAELKTLLQVQSKQISDLRLSDTLNNQKITNLE